MKTTKILISQPAPQSDRSPYFDLQKKYKLEISFRSFIEVKGLPITEFRQQKVSILEHSAVIITSKTAVDNYFRIAEEMRLSIPTSMKYFCTTESLAYYLQKYITYRKRKIFYGEKTIEDLIEVMRKHRNEKFLLPIAEIHKPTIPGKLKKEGFSFSKAIMFKTVSADLSDLSDVTYDILAFFSPAGIVSLQENFPDFKQNNTKIACFGPTTIKAAKGAGINVEIKAPTKKAPSMIMALENYFKEQQISGE